MFDYLRQFVDRLDDDALVGRAAQAIHDGRVLGWFQGRMEFGPRALGNRSLLARPIDAGINKTLNDRLERTEFMPFAPSVLAECADELFTGVSKAAHAAEFMTVTFGVREEWKSRIPAVVHVDGTARPQLVRADRNPLYHALIKRYSELSGIPVVLNTSFNVHEEPIVCAPAEGIRALREERIDALAIGSFSGRESTTLKILHTEASCGWGGQEIRILEESRGLIARGHEITVACPAHARMATEAARFGVPVVALPIEFKTVAGFKALRNYLASHPLDVVNTHSSADSWLTGLACATLAGSPAIVRTRHISAPVSGNPLNRWLYGRAKAVVTTGESLRRHLLDVLQLDPARVVSVPTGIDIERFKPADKAAAKLALELDPARRHVGIVATLRSWKGHRFLLDAFAELNRPDLRLLIVGDGPQLGAIHDQATTLGIASSVILAGQRIDPERWLQAMDVFCLPSYANEGVPQALLQAMLCGLPIVTTPVGAILEAVSAGNTALVVPPNDAAALAGAIARLLDDSTLAGCLGDAARRVASADFSREVMLDKMDAIFRSVLGA